MNCGILGAGSICWDQPCEWRTLPLCAITNKMFTLQVLSKAGCDVPPSVMVSSLAGDPERFREAVRSAASALLDDGVPWPMLAKPNSGGFWDGIVPWSCPE